MLVMLTESEDLHARFELPTIPEVNEVIDKATHERQMGSVKADPQNLTLLTGEVKNILQKPSVITSRQLIVARIVAQPDVVGRVCKNHLERLQVS
jgi:hypothetical protein